MNDQPIGIETRPFFADLAADAHVLSAPSEPPAATPSGTAHLFVAATGSHLRLVDGPPANPATPVSDAVVYEPKAPETSAAEEQPREPIRVADRVSVDDIDWMLVERLTKQLQVDADEHRTRQDFDVATASALPATDFEAAVLREIHRTVRHHNDLQIANRGPDFEWNDDTQHRHAQAVFDSIFRYGRFQNYLREPDIEDISIVGYDNVMVTLSNGRKERRPPIASSDDDLEQKFADLTSWRGRTFSRPSGHIDLDIGGARFSATGRPITSRPNATIRLHNHVDTDLDEMVRLQTITPKMGRLLDAAGKANLSGLVSGWAGAGKTTFLRSWMSTIPWEEKIVTIETEHELYLGKQPHRHAQVQDFQYLPSMLATSDLAATYSLQDAFRESLRSSAQRILFGEIRGAEGPIAIKAMQAGKGSISTIHARSAGDAIHRFADILMSEQSLSDDTVPLRQIMRSIDLIVHLDMLHTPDGSRRRIVTEIAEVTARPNEQLPMASLLYQWDWDRRQYTQPNRPTSTLQQRLTRVGLIEEDFWGA